jgi:PleD family two-component response regulator
MITMKQLFNEADVALYHAKNNGKNQVVSAIAINS